MYPVVGETPPASARDVAEQAVLALNSSMLTLYDESLEKFKQNMRDRVPIILALFTGQGGQMILYRPGQPARSRPARADRLPARQVGRPQQHGDLSDRAPRTWPNPQANQLWRAPAADVPDAEPDGPRQPWRPGHLRRRPGGAPHHSRTQPGLHGRVPRRGDVHLRGRREVHPRHCAPFSVKTIGIGSTRPGGALDEGRRGLEEASWARTGSAPTPSATRCTSRGRTTSCSPSSPSSWARRRWATGCCSSRRRSSRPRPRRCSTSSARIVADRALGMVFFRTTS